MKILFMSPRFPFPPLKGEQLRTYNFIKELSGRGHDIYLITFCRGSDKKRLDKIRKFCREIICIDQYIIEKALSFIRVLFSRVPMQSFPFYSREATKAVNKLLAAHDIDVVQIELVRMAHFIRLFKGTPVVLDLVDSLSMNMYRRFRNEKLLKKAAFYFEWKRMEDYERTMSAKASRTLVVSKSEKEALAYNKNAEVVSVGVRAGRTSGRKDGCVPKKIIFTGNLSYYPNQDAILYFAKDILPLIKSEEDCQFHVVGADPGKKITSLNNGNDIVVKGFVDDIYGYISSADISVAPLRVGSGIQIKVLEAMACGTPVVASDLAIQGIDAINGEHLLIANGPEEFAKNVVRLLRDDKLAKALSQKAFELVSDKYSWDKITERLLEIYRSAAMK